MDKQYRPEKYEAKIYRLWEKSGFFNPDNLPGEHNDNDHDKDKQQSDNKKNWPKNHSHSYSHSHAAFTVVMPPPNAYDQLHMGHAFEVALQDTLIRYQRMLGKKTLWLPGYDHASIATEINFEKSLNQKGKSKHDLGRQKFFSLVWEFSQKNIERVKGQLKALGASCDFSREKFTLDPPISRQVQQTFLELNKNGLIYQDYRLVNWDPIAQTTLSDLEIEHQEIKGKLYFIKYPLHSNSQLPMANSQFITIATTRPETIFADVAVAVQPADERYQNLIGQKAVIPLLQKPVPIMADQAVDPGFGTGALKITPAHDQLDYEIGQRHNLPKPQILDYQGKLIDVPAQFAGKTPAQARPLVVKALQQAGYLEKITPYQQTLALSERTGAQVEPMLGKQWYIKMAPLAKKAIKAVQAGKIKIIPKRFQKTYFEWLRNIKDWPVSRQLWWGQRLPVWYCGTQNIGQLQMAVHKLKPQKGCGEIIFAVQKPSQCPKCQTAQGLIQDPDVFDTWFSSGQWPFNALGFHWQEEPSPDFKNFFPSQLMAPGYEILFFWVARMVMLSLFAAKNIPFETVYLHGLVRDEKGQKMSRSKGNIIEPLQQAKNYGADALRFGLLYGASPGADQAWSPAHLKGGRNFANKLWNLGRLLRIKQAEAGIKKLEIKEIELESLEKIKLDKEDENFLKKLKNTIKKAKKYMDQLDLSSALTELHNFTWHEFADHYIENYKSQIANRRSRNYRQQKLQVLHIFYFTLLKALHPFLPFVTESIWQELLQPKTKKEMLMIQKYPTTI